MRGHLQSVQQRHGEQDEESAAVQVLLGWVFVALDIFVVAARRVVWVFDLVTLCLAPLPSLSTECVLRFVVSFVHGLLLYIFVTVTVSQSARLRRLPRSWR